MAVSVENLPVTAKEARARVVVAGLGLLRVGSYGPVAPAFFQKPVSASASASGASSAM